MIIARDVKDLVMPNLLGRTGRDWLSQVRLNWRQVTSVNTVTKEMSLKQKYGGVFEKVFGVIKGFKGSLVLKETAQPIFCKPRPVPYALHGSVETELKSSVCSDWATPLVTVLKDYKSVRLCGGYRVTVNPHLKIDHYPLSLPEDIFATVAGGTVFTVLDLSKAYLQLELDEHSQEILTVNTLLGFRFRRLPYGVASAVGKTEVARTLSAFYSSFRSMAFAQMSQNANFCKAVFGSSGTRKAAKG